MVKKETSVEPLLTRKAQTADPAQGDDWEQVDNSQNMGWGGVGCSSPKAYLRSLLPILPRFFFFFCVPHSNQNKEVSL